MVGLFKLLVWRVALAPTPASSALMSVDASSPPVRAYLADLSTIAKLLMLISVSVYFGSRQGLLSSNDC